MIKINDIEKKLDTNDCSFSHITLTLSLHYPCKIPKS